MTPPRFGIAWLTAAAWTLAVGASLAWNLLQEREQVLAQARAEAIANYNKDITFRRWGTRHGGVYVPVTETQQSVPWLSHVPGRDVETSDGQRLTLLNPASMLRQMMDVYDREYGIKGRITGLKQLNPGNAPDAWEREQLEAFTRGEKHEVWAYANLNGAPYLRYLRAMYMEPGCEKCHAILGYKLGDMRGATGVNLPLASYYASIDAANRVLQLSHGGIWLLGLAGIGWAARRQRSDARERETIHQALRSSEERFDLAVRGARDGVWDMDLVTGGIYHSPRMWEMLGYSEMQLPASMNAWAGILHPEDMAVALAALDAHLRDPSLRYETMFRARHADGSWRWILSRGESVRDAEGRCVRMVGTHADITPQKQLEAQLFAEKERAQVTLASIGDAVLTTDAEGDVDFLNPVAEQLTGWRQDEARGLPVETVAPLYDEHTRAAVEGPVSRCRRDGRAVGLAEYTLLINRRGEEIAIDDNAAPIRDPEGRLIGVVMVFRDVTEARALTRQMSWQISHDALTGLISRREFERRLGLLVEDAKVSSHQHALVYLDLDQFKVVNDTSGHQAGDELLKQLAFLLAEPLRRNDLLARLGGDEFAALLENCPEAKALSIAEKLRSTVADFRFGWNAKSFDVGVSIGLAMIDRDTASAQEALRAADVACYAAKDKGRNRVERYRPGDATLQARSGEVAMISELRTALNQGRFQLLAQEIRDYKQPDWKKYEVLLRMVDHQGNLVSPHAFIPVAERYGVMPAIDRWVLEQSLAALARAKNPEIRLTINLSGLSLIEDGMLEFIRAAFLQHCIDPARITFEVTETAAIAHLARGVQFMRELAALGCRFALDDFGSGMSSFAYLKTLPVRVLKIDGAFVRDLLEDPVDRAFVEAIHHIGHLMGMETVAEYVENEALLRVLGEIGIDQAQGWAVGKPRPLEAVLRGD